MNTRELCVLHNSRFLYFFKKGIDKREKKWYTIKAVKKCPISSVGRALDF